MEYEEEKDAKVCPSRLVDKNEDSKDKTSKTVELLTNGLLNLYEPPFAKVNKDLNDLIEKQNKIQADLTTERDNFTVQNLYEAQIMMDNLAKYREKLLNIKKQMTSIHHKTTSLKKRANHIKEFKEKELEVKIQKRQNEENLIAKGPGPSPNMPNT